MTHSAAPRVPLFCSTTFWSTLWSITEQTHGNLKSIFKLDWLLCTHVLNWFVIRIFYPIFILLIIIICHFINFLFHWIIDIFVSSHQIEAILQSAILIITNILASITFPSRLFSICYQCSTVSRKKFASFFVTAANQSKSLN